MEAVTDLEAETQTGGCTPVLVAQINTEPVPSEVPRATFYGTNNNSPHNISRYGDITSKNYTPLPSCIQKKQNKLFR